MHAIRCQRQDCQTLLIWLPTKTGRHIPLEAASVDDKDRVYDPEKHQEHWSKCLAVETRDAT